jgi:hypothetical protein
MHLFAFSITTHVSALEKPCRKNDNNSILTVALPKVLSTASTRKHFSGFQQTMCPKQNAKSETQIIFAGRAE